MILDTSAVLAILLDEPERRRFNEAIEAASSLAISAANFVEGSILTETRFGAGGLRDLDMPVKLAAIEIAEIDEARMRRVGPTLDSAKDVIPRPSTWGTVSRTRWRSVADNASFSRAKTSPRPEPGGASLIAARRLPFPATSGGFGAGVVPSPDRRLEFGVLG